MALLTAADKIGGRVEKTEHAQRLQLWARDFISLHYLFQLLQEIQYRGTIAGTPKSNSKNVKT